MASESQGLSQLNSGTGWEHSMNCWELCPYKSPGDVASRHLPRSLDRSLHTVTSAQADHCVWRCEQLVQSTHLVGKGRGR